MSTRLWSSTATPTHPWQTTKGKLYNLPFNMNTFYQMWGVTTPAEAKAKIEEQKAEAIARMKADGVSEPRNLEEQAQTLIGKDIYEKLIKAIPRSNGDGNVRSFRLSSSRGCPCVWFSTITILMTNTRGFPSADIMC